MSARLRDRDVEQLLTRSTLARDDLGELEGFVAVLSSEQMVPGDVSQMATSLAALARSTGRPTRKSWRRITVATAAAGALMLFSGLAMAADGAAPGHPLYQLDQALEMIGIGNGGNEERIQEFRQLLEKGSAEEAFEFLQNGVGPEGAETSLEDVLLPSSASNAATDAQQKVTQIHDFITENRGKDRGADGADFGQGVADIASSKGAEEPPGPTGQPSSSKPEHAGVPGKPEHAGVPGQPDHAEGNEHSSGNGQSAGDTDDPAAATSADPEDPDTAESASPSSKPDHANSTGRPDHAGEPGPEHAGPKNQP